MMKFFFPTFIFAGLAAAVTAQTCFETREQLDDAISVYLVDPTDQTSSAALEYGWPIGTWCVSAIEDFSLLFNFRQDFDEELDDWDMSSATNLQAMFR